MKRTGIKFESGSGRYDPLAEIFRFRATDDHGRIPCAISQEAAEAIFRAPIDEATANTHFSLNEKLVFKIAEQKYHRGEINAQGAIAISSLDRLAH